MLKIESLYVVLGIFVAIAALMNLRERRYSLAAFWAIVAAAFVFGDAVLAASARGSRWPAQAMGMAVIALGILASRVRLAVAARTPAEDAAQSAGARRFGNRLFWPALLIPLLTIVLVLAAPYLRIAGRALIEPSHATLVALGVACVIAFIAALMVTRATPITGIGEGRRLLDALGWAVLLPMLLATLGSVFAATGVGDAIAGMVVAVIPADSRFACLAAFALGMVLFTVIMGNAFAAFPVLMAGIGLPLLVERHGAHPAVLGSIGMLVGYCGTLLTPMAANFNIVPVVLLELPDPYAVIRAQWPTAILLLAFNVVLLAWLAFR